MFSFQESQMEEEDESDEDDDIEEDEGTMYCCKISCSTS